MAARDDEIIRLHNYNVNNYKKLIPRAFNRAALAYRDNNLQLKELIDQYQFQGQERLRQSVGQQGALEGLQVELQLHKILPSQWRKVSVTKWCLVICLEHVMALNAQTKELKCR